MNAIIAEESVLRGWSAGFRAGLGAASADAVFFVLALLGAVAIVQRSPVVEAAMVGVGGLLMCYYAYDAVAELDETFRHEAPRADADADADGSATPPEPNGSPDDPASEPAAVGTDGGATDGVDPGTGPGGATDLVAGTGFRKAFVLALTNPYQIVFWLTVGVGLLEPGTVDVLARLPAVGTDLAGLLVVETGSPALLGGLFVGIGVWITGFPAALVTAERRVDRFAPAVAALSALVLAGFGVLFLVRAARTLGA
jgi:threonine/homoserine/homoserine lactone efflux protein